MPRFLRYGAESSFEGSETFGLHCVRIISLTMRKVYKPNVHEGPSFKKITNPDAESNRTGERAGRMHGDAEPNRHYNPRVVRLRPWAYMVHAEVMTYGPMPRRGPVRSSGTADI